MFDLLRLFCLSTLVFILFALQSRKKVTSDPSPFVQFRVAHKSCESKVRPHSDPQQTTVSVSFQHHKSLGAFRWNRVDPAQRVL